MPTIDTELLGAVAPGSETSIGGRAMRGTPVFIALFTLLLILWVGAFLVFHVASLLIHLLLVLALVSLVVHLFRRKSTPSVPKENK